MTQTEEIRIFNQSIVPLMDKLHKEHPHIGADMFFVSVVSDLRKKNVQLSNNIVNMMMDRMAKYIVPQSSWDYISGKISDNNIIKTVFDMTHSDAADTPMQAEIKRRAELMYKASTPEKIAASLATAGTDVVATAPIAVLCPQSVVYSFLIQGGYDIVNETVLLPESKEERQAVANDSISRYNALEERTNGNIIPGWMPGKFDITDYNAADDNTLKKARDWAKRNAQWWHDEYEKLGREKKNSALVNGKTYTRTECLVKYNQYEKFRGECQRPLSERYLAQLDAKKEEAQEPEGVEVTLDNMDEVMLDGKASAQASSDKGTDMWGQLLNTLGFSGLGNVGKHLGLTLATLPDMIFGVFTGKTKSLGMNKDTLIPLAALAAGKFVKNPMLKAALMGYGGLNLLNKVGNEAIAQQRGGQSETNSNVQYKKYADEELNPRISNVHIEGNQMLADIDKVPCAISLPDTTVKAYQNGALPLNTLANAVLAKSDLMAQQTQQASLAYEQNQQQQQTRGIR